MNVQQEENYEREMLEYKNLDFLKNLINQQTAKKQKIQNEISQLEKTLAQFKTKKQSLENTVEGIKI